MTVKTNEPMRVDTKLVRELAKMLDDTGLTEIEVADGERKVRVARQGAPMATVAASALAPVAAPVVAPAPAAPVDPHPGTVKSPMVGTVYLASSPESANFISIGAMVKEGDTLVIIEAMKVMNPITATRAGKITQIIVANGQPVEFDQPLVVIE